MASRPDDVWIPIEDAPFSRATAFRLAKNGLLLIRKMLPELHAARRRAYIMQREVDGIIALLKKGKTDVHH